MRISDPNACEATILHGIQVGVPVQQQSIDCAPPGTDPESVGSFRSIYTERSDILFAVLDLEALITEQFKSDVERHARILVKLITAITLTQT